MILQDYVTSEERLKVGRSKLKTILMVICLIVLIVGGFYV